MSWDIFQGLCMGSGFARNEPCLPGCVGGSEPEHCGVQVAGYDACILGYDPAYSTFGSSSCGFTGGSSIESCAPGERGFGIRNRIITPDTAEFSYFGHPDSGHDSGSYDPGYPSGDYDSCPDDSGYPSGEYDFCSDNSGKLSI